MGRAAAVSVEGRKAVGEAGPASRFLLEGPVLRMKGFRQGGELPAKALIEYKGMLSASRCCTMKGMPNLEQCIPRKRLGCTG